MQQVNIEQAKLNLTVLIKAAINGEEVVITQDEKTAQNVNVFVKSNGRENCHPSDKNGIGRL